MFIYLNCLIYLVIYLYYLMTNRTEQVYSFCILANTYLGNVLHLPNQIEVPFASLELVQWHTLQQCDQVNYTFGTY